MFCISVNKWHRRAVSFNVTAHIHTSAWCSLCFQHKWGHKYTNNIPRTARRVTWWAFDCFIWVKRSSYHIYIGYRNLKGPHGNLSKYKFGLAEYITVYVIQLQQLLQLLLKIITQYAKYVYFVLQNVYRMLLGDLCTYVIINIINITVYLMLLLLTVFRIKDMFKSI